MCLKRNTYVVGDTEISRSLTETQATVEKQSDAKGNEQPEAVDQLKKALTVSRACERMVLLDAQKIRDGALPKVRLRRTRIHAHLLQHTISDVWCELPATPAATQILEELCMALIPTDIVAPQAIVFIQCASLDPLLTAHNILGKYGFQHVPIPLVVNLDSSAISSAPLGLPQDGCHQIWMFTRSAKRVKFSGVFKKQTNCFLAIASNLVHQLNQTALVSFVLTATGCWCRCYPRRNHHCDRSICAARTRSDAADQREACSPLASTIASGVTLRIWHCLLCKGCREFRGLFRTDLREGVCCVNGGAVSRSDGAIRQIHHHAASAHYSSSLS